MSQSPFEGMYQFCQVPGDVHGTGVLLKWEYERIISQLLQKIKRTRRDDPKDKPRVKLLFQFRGP